MNKIYSIADDKCNIISDDSTLSDTVYSCGCICLSYNHWRVCKTHRIMLWEEIKRKNGLGKYKEGGYS